jgi:hypothetical protein
MDDERLSEIGEIVGCCRVSPIQEEHELQESERQGYYGVENG